jgi:uncharacterized protein YkwD
MKKILITIFILTLIALIGCANTELTDREQEYIDSINRIRLDNELNELDVDVQLSISAQKRAEYIISTGEVKHAPLSYFTDNVKRTRTILAGEIIARTRRKNTDIDVVINAWLNSKTHRDVILNKSYGFERIGVSINDFGDGEIIIILFASR